jgi:ATP-dependent helicase/nuclease subunit A
LKQQSNSLDYDDLISLTRKLLNNSEYSDWISYKLDGGIDHLLLDEAQDTSSTQWQIINKITEEFFYQHEKPRSFFIVGDAKQSIFSFQGADPKLFNEMNHYLPSEVIRVSLNKSYRSGIKILQLVDKIFNNPAIKPLVTSIDPFIKHIAHKDIEGKIEIWPLIIDKEAKEDTPWAMPSDFMHLDGLTSQDILAKNIAEYIERQVIDPGDVLVLTRRRTGFVNSIISELKLRNIPVNGLDRLALIEHKAILDLVALINVILYPLDDFNLAIVLKSPIFGITEEELLNLCYNRSASLWESLQDKKILEELIVLSKEKTLFEFFFDILESKDIRPKFEREFGIEVNDVLDSFLDLVVQFEKENISCLQLFLDYLNNNKTEVKRDLSHSKGQVRIMTVHGAKGLQAKTVILADTTSLPHNFDSIIWLNDRNLVWSGREKYYSKSSIEAKEIKMANEYAEYIRLLYVALTRAEENIIICGTYKAPEAPNRSWYHIVHNALSENDDT